MRIGMLLDHPFPYDTRVANEARSLVDAGHEVSLFCLNVGGAAPARETFDGVEIVRHAISQAFWKKASALVLTLPSYNLWFRPRLRRFLRHYRIEALHVHDLPLVGEGLRAARRAGIPLIADLHENYPAAIRLYDWRRRFPARLLVRPRQWDTYEARILPQVDRIIVVIDEARDRLLRLGLPAARIAVVENTVAVEEFVGFPRDEALIERLAARFTVSYVGHFDRHRGLETAIEAVGLIKGQMPDLLLVLAGTGTIQGALARKTLRLGIGKQVSFEGWQPFPRFPSYMRGSRVCLIPHVKSPHTDTTIPHKLFHAMILERPVVASNCAPIERILRETNAGLVYPSGDAQQLAGALLALRDRDLRGRLGQAGKRAVLERYRWQVSARRLIDLYAGF